MHNLFSALNRQRPSIVIADLTLFTQEDTDTVDACLCLGASIATSVGVATATSEYVYCVVGDTSFLHGGVDILVSVFQYQYPICTIIIDNGGSACTGGQACTISMDHVGKIIPLIILEYADLSVDDFDALFSEAKNSGKPKCIVLKV